MKTPAGISDTIRNVKRAQDILTVLTKYGFASVIQDLGLDSLILKGKQLVGAAPRNEALVRQPNAVRLRKAMEELGGTFIKLGQVMSTRPDLVPPEWALEFRKLQGDVPPAPWEKVEGRLRKEFGEELDTVFRSIEPEALAAASIAQVHRAVLTDGTNVVLKILRPGMEGQIDSDIDLLRYLANFVEGHFTDLGYSPVDVVEAFARELAREIDLKQEGRATERMRQQFKGCPGIRFPKVYWEATRDRVLALEEIRGRLLARTEREDIDEAERRLLVANGTEAVFRQCLELGFFHADPHPGNIFALEGGVVCFIDCGMTGHIDRETAGNLADLVYGTINGDLDAVIETTLDLADASPDLGDDRLFRADVFEFISRFEDVTLDQLDIGHLLDEFFSKVRKHHLRVPADLVFLIKAITTIESVGEWLVPEFDIVGHVRPHVDRLVRRRYGIRALRERLQSTLADYARLVELLPTHVRSVMYQLRRTNLTVNLEHKGLDELEETIDHASDTIAHAVLVGSLIMGSSVLILADSVRPGEGIGWLTTVAIAGFVMALLMIAGRFIRRRFR